MTYRSALSTFHDLAPFALSKDARMGLLQAFAVIALSDRRVKSADMRRQQWKGRTARMNPHDWNGKVCFVCGERATQRHHIIPIGRGWLPSKKNTVWIDRACHKAIHPWLS